MRGAVVSAIQKNYLCVVGSDQFWRDFAGFAREIGPAFKCTLMPFFMPHPAKIPDAYLVRLHQGQTTLRARWLGDFVGGTDWRFALWEPLTDFFIQKGTDKKDFVNTTAIIANQSSKKIVIECPKKAWAGVASDFCPMIPADIEKDFIPLLLKKIQKAKPLNIKFEAPNDDNLNLGFDRAPPPLRRLITTRLSTYMVQAYSRMQLSSSKQWQKTIISM